MTNSDCRKKFKTLVSGKTAIWLVPAVLFLCVAVIFISFVMVTLGDGIANGIRIEGTNVSKMTQYDAKNVIQTGARLDDLQISLYTKGNRKTSFSGIDIELRQDTEKTVQKAYSVGRGENVFKNAAELVCLYFKPKNINFQCTYNREKLSKIIYDLGVEVNGELKDYIFEFDGETVNVKKGVSGQSRNVDKAICDFDDAISRGIYNVCIRLDRDEPKTPCTESLYNELYIAPVNAYYEIVDRRVKIFPEVVGRQIDKNEAEANIDRIRNGEAVSLKLLPIFPKVTADTLSSTLFSHSLATYSTTYSTAARGRSENVRLAAAKIDKVVLSPGEVFSFNEVVGPRSRAAGFRDAPVYENGETVEGVGGGVCQVSSTLYSAVLYADLKIASRRNHSMTVAYVPRGQDATVSYGTIDFKFENSTEYPIKISASANGGTLTVSIFGTKPEKKKTVKIVNNTVSTKAPTVEEIQDSTMLAGTRKVISKGKTGYTVETKRIVSEDGVEIKTEMMGRSVYKMVPTRVAIGAQAPDVTPSPEELQPPPDAVGVSEAVEAEEINTEDEPIIQNGE